MASINVTEADYEAVACAAMDAEEAGEIESALTLDKLARKINAALSAQTAARANPFPTYRSKTSWRDMPSTLKGTERRPSEAEKESAAEAAPK